MTGDPPIPNELVPLAPPRRSSLAQASLIFGIASLPLCEVVVCGMLAVVTGHLARRRIRMFHGQLTGAGMALAGIILGYFSLLIMVMSNHDHANAINSARKTTALATATAIRNAVGNFRTEYGKLPDVVTRVTTDTGDGLKLLAVLLATEPPSAGMQNPRMIKFLSVREAKNKKHGLIYNSSGTMVEGLYDPWGGPYTIELTEDRVTVCSPGSDVVLGTADDVRTW